MPIDDTFAHDLILPNPVEKDQGFAADESTTPTLHDPPQRDTTVEPTNPKTDDLLTETLKELDNDDLVVELEKALSGGAISITSSAKTLYVESGTQPVNVPTIKLLIKCYKLIEDKDLKYVRTDEELIGKLTEKLTKLGSLHAELHSAFKETATKLERFYKDILNHYAPINEALARHTSMVNAK